MVKKMDEIVKKINEFTKLSKERELTEEEKKEREKYRRIYKRIENGKRTQL